MTSETTQLVGRTPQERGLIRVEYHCSVEPGILVASTRRPQVIRLGDNNLPPGAESIFRTMRTGERRFKTIPPADAYGEMDINEFHTLRRDDMPRGAHLQVGERLRLRDASGQSRIGTIVNLSERHALVNFNHPLAGKPLHCSLHLIDRLPGDCPSAT